MIWKKLYCFIAGHRFKVVNITNQVFVENVPKEPHGLWTYKCATCGKVWVTIGPWLSPLAEKYPPATTGEKK